jgi:Holliday junction resolvase
MVSATIYEENVMSTHDFGRELENYICEKFKELNINAYPSNGSGNKGSVGDISGQDLFGIEAKNRNTKDITIKEDIWNKLCNEIPYHSERKPMYVLGNKNKQRWVVMNIEDFFEILKGYLEAKNG